MTIRLYRAGRQLRIKGLPDHWGSALRMALSIRHPQEYLIKQRNPWMVSNDPLKADKWDGRIHYFERNESEGYWWCGIGLHERFRAALGAFLDDSVTVQDEINLDTGLTFANHLDGAKLTASQIEASRPLLAKSTGALELDVSSGKSYILLNLAACALASYPDWTVAVVVPRKALLHQMVRDARHVLPHFDVGVLGDGERQINQITISTVATAAAPSRIKNRKDIKDWLRNINVLIFDEAHHVGAATWQAVLEQSSADILWGVSAKFTFKAGQRPLERTLEAAFGPPVFKGRVDDFRVPVQVVVHQDETWRGALDSSIPGQLHDGCAAMFKIKGVPGWHHGVYRGPTDGVAPECCRDNKGKVNKALYGMRLADDTDALKPVSNVEEVVYNTASDMGIMEFKRRDDWAIALAKRLAARQEVFLITVLRSRHLKKLVARFKRETSLVIGQVYGGMSKKQSERVFAAWRSGELAGVVAQTSCVSEGVSVPILTHLIKMDGLGSEMVAHQAAGRPARVEGPDKTTGYVHIPWDCQHQHLLATCESVIRYYLSIGLPVQRVKMRYD